MDAITIVLISAATATGLLLLVTLGRKKPMPALERARRAGVCMDDDGNIDAESSFAGMMLREETTGEQFTGKQARFMELMRVVSEGPKNVDEIRFLFEESIDAVVRPDGLVYVTCIENEHLYMEGEIELREEDLEAYVNKEKTFSTMADCPAA